MSDDRPKVGPADPETRKKLLREQLDKPTGSDGFVQRMKAAKVKKKAGSLGDLLDPTVPRERTQDGKTMTQVVDEAVKGAKPDPY